MFNKYFLFIIISLLFSLPFLSGCIESSGQDSNAPIIDTVIEATDTDFEDIVLNSKLPVVIDFWSPECGPCVKMKPEFDQIAQDYAGEILVVSVNTSKNPETNNKYGQAAQPYTSFYLNGKELSFHLGYLNADQLSDLIDAVFDL